MQSKIIHLANALFITGILGLSGCASTPEYQHAFAATSAIKGSHQSFTATPDTVFKAVKLTFIRQGFTVEQVDVNNGVIKASRNLADTSNNKISYNISVTADITGDSKNSDTQVSLAASQQTVLHRSWHTWWHLLGIIPLFPTGQEYQTIVTKEGNVTDSVFYNDFFKNVNANLTTTQTTDKANQ